MAGDWIPMRMDLLDDPAVIAIAAALNMEEYAVAGRLLKLWSWANRHLKDGHASVPDKWVDDYLDTAGFAAAMLRVGWLRTRSGGGLEFTSFDRWNSQGAKIRLGETLRKRAFRERKGHKDCPDSVPARVPKVSRTKPPARPGPEKRRGEKSKDPPNPPKGGGENPEEVNTPPPRARDLLFDAVAEVTASDPATAGGHVGKVKVALEGADPSYTPEEVREFGRRFHEFCSWAAKDGRANPTLGELQKYIGRVRAGKSPPSTPKPGKGYVEFGNAEPMTFRKEQPCDSPT